MNITNFLLKDNDKNYSYESYSNSNKSNPVESNFSKTLKKVDKNQNGIDNFEKKRDNIKNTDKTDYKSNQTIKKNDTDDSLEHDNGLLEEEDLSNGSLIEEENPTEEEKPIEKELQNNVPYEIIDSLLSQNLEVVDNIVFELTTVLEITVEKFDTLLKLNNLNLQDLKNNENLIEFLKIYYEVDDVEELLELPDVNNVLNEIKATLNKLELKDYSILNSENKNVKYIIVDNEIFEEVEDYTFETDFIENDDSHDNFLNNSDESQDDNSPTDNLNKHVSLYDVDKNFNTEFSQEELLDDRNLNITNIETKKLNSIIELKQVALSRNINPNLIINQISDSLKVNLKGDTSEIRVTLSPQHLGDVTFKIAIINGNVAAQFIAENSKVKEIIEANLQLLRDSLEEKGINISSLYVSVGDESNQNMNRYLKEKQKSALRASKIAANIMIEEENNNKESLLEKGLINYKI